MQEPPIDKSLASLDPEFREIVEALLAKLEKAGIPFRPSETRRTAARQRWLFAAGRTRPGPKVTQKDGEPGVYPKDYAVVSERGKTRASRHQSGFAVDLYPVRPDGRIYIPPADDEVWFLLASAARAAGLRAGRDWGDSPHVELRRSAAQREETGPIGKQVGDTGPQAEAGQQIDSLAKVDVASSTLVSRSTLTPPESKG